MSTYDCMSLAFLPAFLALALPWQSTDPALPKAESILAKLEAAIGDGAARAKATNVVMTGTLNLADLEGGNTVEEVYVGHERVKQTISYGGEDYGSMGSTGAWSWSTEPTSGITIKEDDEQGSVKRRFGIARRAPWSTLYARAQTVRKSEHGARPHWELRMIPRVGAAETWFVDCESHVLSRVDLALPNPQGGEIPMQFHFADFKRVDGILYPHVKKQVVGETELVTKYSSITHPVSVDDARVAPPADVAEAFADPKKRAIPDDPNACKLETIDAQPAATIRVTIKPSDVSRTLATIIPEVCVYVSKAGGTMAGPPFTRYHRLGADELEIEAGLPLAKALQGEGRIRFAELPGGRTVVAWHLGPYHEMQKSYKRVEAWMKSQKLEARAAPWEIYWTDPGIESDPTNWRTQILWPVK